MGFYRHGPFIGRSPPAAPQGVVSAGRLSWRAYNTQQHAHGGACRSTTYEVDQTVSGLRRSGDCPLAAVDAKRLQNNACGRVEHTSECHRAEKEGQDVVITIGARQGARHALALHRKVRPWCAESGRATPRPPIEARRSAARRNGDHGSARGDMDQLDGNGWAEGASTWAPVLYNFCLAHSSLSAALAHDSAFSQAEEGKE